MSLQQQAMTEAGRNATDAENGLRLRLQWFLLLRVGITTCLLGITAFLYSHYGSSEVPAGGLLLSAIAVAYFVSLVSGLLLTHLHNLAVFSYLQVVFDTLFVTGVVLFTGDLSSPFSFLYHLIILNAAFLLFRRGALVAASLAALCYGVTGNLLYYGVSSSPGLGAVPSQLQHTTPNLHLTIQLAVYLSSFYVIAFLGSYLAQRLMQVETLLAERNVALDRISSLYQGVVQNLESGVLITNAAGLIEYVNGALGEILDSAPSFLIGKKVQEVLALLPTDYPLSEPTEFTLPGNSTTSKERTLRATHSLLSDTYGNRIGSLYSIQDVTGIKELEQGLRETEELESFTDQTALPGSDSFAGLVGRSDRMQKVYQLIAKVAAGTTTVLITGESGTGKELVARAIHEKGERATQPFVPVNCGAIPDTLIESELFGYVKGAFTGAIKDRLGLFRQANEGTLFLDEIGEMPLTAQVKLLRVLQEREIMPVGGSTGVPVDVRVIAATNKNLEKEVVAGRFREDLFYRLNVVSVPLPPLRERQGDLLLLIHHFLKYFSIESEKTVCQVSPQAMRTLLEHTYPGNIRELENIIHHAVTMTEGETIRSGDLPAHLRPSPTNQHASSPLAEKRNGHASQPDFFGKGISLDDELEEYEQRILRAALEQAGGVQKKAAEVLGINYRSFRHRLQKYRLS